jgi:hypothetical protein
VSVLIPGVLSIAFWRRLLLGVGVAYIGVSLTLGGNPEAKSVYLGLAISWAFFLILHYREVQTGRTLPRNPRSRRFRCNALVLGRLESIAALILLAVGGAELCLRAYGAYSGSSLVVGNKLDAYRLLPGQDYGAGLRGNRLGYPGSDFQRAKKRNVPRIAALGNSFAIGYAVPYADNYITVLGGKLRGAEVYNFGVSGAGPREYFEILENDVWHYRPDLVLVSVFVGNNITEMMPGPRYMDPRQHALYVVLERGWRHARETLRPNPTTTIQEKVRWPPPGLTHEVFRAVETRRLEICLKLPSASLEKKWRRTWADLEKIISACRRRRVPLAVVVIPDEFQVNPRVLAEAAEDSHIKPAALDLELPQRRLGRFFAERRIPCLDLLPVFRKTPCTYVRWETHWNARGHHLAATELARWLQPLLPGT